MFNERFTFDNTDLKTYINNTDNPEDSELENRSERLTLYAREVRRFSVLLNQVSTWDIYQTAVYNSDPHIALVLASAKDQNGDPQFPTKESITDIIYTTSSNSLFQDGVKRVSIAFTASILIGQLSQLPEQFNHFESIRDQAIADLDRIVSLPESQNVGSPSEEEDLSVEGSVFYWNPGFVSFDTDDTLSVDIYVSSESSLSTWQNVETYTTDTSLATIVSDIADFIF